MLFQSWTGDHWLENWLSGKPRPSTRKDRARPARDVCSTSVVTRLRHIGEHSFNPLDRVELGRSVGRALLLSPCESLPPVERFQGAGIYAIYYHGDFAPYRPVALPECEWPIYVGRAMPSGGRAGLLGLGSSPEPKLHSRLREHARSMEAVSNLDIADFRCRYLIVDDIWIPLAERLLIGHYRPLWNGVVDGFGIHAPGGKPGGTKGRGGQMKSPWDTLHPGRPFAEGRPNRVEEREIRTKIKAHLHEHPPRRGEPPALGDDPVSAPPPA